MWLCLSKISFTKNRWWVRFGPQVIVCQTPGLNYHLLLSFQNCYFFTMSLVILSKWIFHFLTQNALMCSYCIRSQAKLGMASMVHITGATSQSGVISYLAHFSSLASFWYFSISSLRTFAHAVSFHSKSSSPLSASLSSQCKLSSPTLSQ